MTSDNLKKPNVLIAGFPRSGTTHIYHLLTQHPDIFIPEIKGPQHFNKDHFFLEDPEVLNPKYFKSDKWYLSFFKTDKKVVIDFSYYSAMDVASARRVYNLLGDIKIVFIVRNKEDFKNSVKKALSKWRTVVDQKIIDEYSDFDYYIEQYKRFFSKVHVVYMDEYNKNQNDEIQKLFAFMELQEHKVNFNVDKHESANTDIVSGFAYLRHVVYLNISRFYFTFLSWNAWARAKPYEK